MKKIQSIGDLKTVFGEKFVELPEDVLLKAIEGYEDEIAPAEKAAAAFYRQFSCPSCHGTSLSREYLGGARGAGTTWVPGEILPQALLRCSACKALFSPHTGIIVEKGNHATIIPVDDDIAKGQ